MIWMSRPLRRLVESRAPGCGRSIRRRRRCRRRPDRAAGRPGATGCSCPSPIRPPGPTRRWPAGLNETSSTAGEVRRRTSRHAAVRATAACRPCARLGLGTTFGASGARSAKVDCARRRGGNPGASCRDASAPRTERSVAPCSTTRPASITAMRSHHRAARPRSWVIRIMAMPRSAWMRARSSITVCCVRDVEAGRRLVGDQQGGLAGDRHGDHDALAHAARQLVRIGRQPGLRIADAAPRCSSSSACARAEARRQPAVRGQHVDDLLLDGADRVQRGARVLEDHRQRRAAQPAQVGVAGVGDVAASRSGCCRR